MSEDNIYQRREKRKRARLQYTANTSFKNYIRDMVQVLHTQMQPAAHGQSSISAEALQIADSVLMDVFEDIVTEARKLMVAAKRRTLMARDIQFAVLHTLGGEVARHAMSEGHRAVTKYEDMARQG